MRRGCRKAASGAASLDEIFYCIAIKKVKSRREESLKTLAADLSAGQPWDYSTAFIKIQAVFSRLRLCVFSRLAIVFRRLKVALQRFAGSLGRERDRNIEKLILI